MNRRRAGFTLLELVIAMALTGFIIIGMMQGYRNALNLLTNARTLLSINRRVALLFNQIERDFTTVFVYEKPVKMAKPKATPKADESGQPSLVDKKPEPAEEKKAGPEEPVYSLVAEVFEDGAYRHEGKKLQMTRLASVVCTSPLEVFGVTTEKRVRVCYELVYDKGHSTPQQSSYTLWRKETPELENMLGKERGDEGAAPLRKHIVAERVKALSLEYAYELKRDEKEPKKTEEVEQQRTFIWGKKEEEDKSATIYPESVTVHLELWDMAIKNFYTFDCMMPLFVRDEVASKRTVASKKEEPPVEQKEAVDQQQPAAPSPDGPAVADQTQAVGVML